MTDTEKSDDTKQRLLEAAQRVVADRGWAAATSRAIAGTADVNLALINYHFGSKSALLLAAFEAAVDRLGAAAPPADTGRHPLVDVVRSAERIATDVSSRVLLAGCVEATRDPEVRAVVTEKLRVLRAMVLGMLGGRARERGLATLLAAALDGLLLHRAIDPETDLRAAARALSELLSGVGQG